MNSPLSLSHKKLESSETSAAVAYELSSDSLQAASVGLWALALGFGGFLVWASLAPLDEGVPAPGMVTIDTKRKPVQSASGGIVKEVLVREAQEVSAGQVLLRMDDAIARSNFEGVRQRYLSLRAMQGRLQAEQLGRATVQFHPDLQAAAKDPLIQQQMQTQLELFAARKAALAADLQGIEESIRGQASLLKSYEGILVNRRQQQALLMEELTNTRSLIKEGYAPRNRGLELERMAAEASSVIADLQGSTARATFGIAELRQRSIQRQKEYRKEVESQLADVTREVQGDEVKFKAVSEDLARAEVRAPVAGNVLGLAVQTPGSVVQPGQKLLDVVPENEMLVIESHVAPHLIDKVRVGLPVDIRFSAFAHSPQLVVQGEVSSISSDLIVEPQSNVSYYLARVHVTKEGIKTLGARQMQPGMPAEVVLKTGERSLLTYWLHPLTKRIAASMNEE